MPIPAFLINLDSNKERLDFVSAELKLAGIEFSRVSAVDCRNLDVHAIDGYDDAAARGFMGRSLRGGEIGCYKSHLECLRLLLATGAPYGLVLEDDIDIHPQALDILGQAIAHAERCGLTFDVIHAGADRIKIARKECGLGATGDFALLHAYYFPMTTSALLWSRDGAERFLRGAADIGMPVDNALRQAMIRSGRGMAIWPPLARQTGVVSDIDGNRNSRKFEDRSWKYGYLKQKRLLLGKAVAMTRKYIG